MKPPSDPPAPRRKALGRGLDALLTKNRPGGDAAATPTAKTAGDGDQIRKVPLDLIDPNPDQPRTLFEPESIEELAQSIRNDGLIQPVLVRPNGSRYLLVVGERRLRAAKLAGLAEIPAIVRELDREKSLELALIENIQRENLNPIEVATALVVASSLAGVVLRFWSRRRSLALLGVTAFVLAGAGAYNGAKIPDSIEAFRVNFYRWTFVVAWLAWLALGWSVALALRRWSGLRDEANPIAVPRWAPFAAALVMLVPAAGATFTAGFDDERRDQAGFATMRQLSDAAN